VCVCVCVCMLDIDECEFENGGCSQLCENIVGSFVCSCHSGFQIGNDAVSCFSQSSSSIAVAPPPPRSHSPIHGKRVAGI